MFCFVEAIVQNPTTIITFEKLKHTAQTLTNIYDMPEIQMIW